MKISKLSIDNSNFINMFDITASSADGFTNLRKCVLNFNSFNSAFSISNSKDVISDGLNGSITIDSSDNIKTHGGTNLNINNSKNVMIEDATATTMTITNSIIEILN